MTPKASRDELIALRTLNEQRWAYDRRMEHLSYREMRRLVGQAPPTGLGYDLSEHVLKSLVNGYRARMADVHAIDIEEHRERELEDLDLAMRRAEGIVQLAVASLKRAADAGALDVHAGKLLLDANRQLIGAGESRRKLLGLDAPSVAKVDVVHHDGVIDELNAMLARLGEAPIEVPSD